jgi:hypothetical protein
MMAQYISTLLPLGHIKSVIPHDEKFVAFFSKAKKWLKIAHANPKLPMP